MNPAPQHTSAAPPARPEPQRLWQRYVAVGDSFTEGMSDPDPRREDAYLGWADRLAVNLACQHELDGSAFGYANLAIRGRLLDDVAGPQLDAALELEPDLVSIVGGGNNIMRPKVDIDAISDELEEAVVRIRATGADVLLATGARPAFAPSIGPVAHRVSSFIACQWGIAQRHGCYVVDLWSMRALRDERMWATDRLHLSTEGHRRVAQQASWTLGLPTTGDWLDLLPPSEPKPMRARLAENAEWTREYVGPWVQRRVKGVSSGDGREPKRPELARIDLDVARSLLDSTANTPTPERL